MGPEAERILEVGTAALQPPRGAKQRGLHALEARIAEPPARPRWVVPLAAALALAAAIVLLWSLASSRVVVADRTGVDQASDHAAVNDETRILGERSDAAPAGAAAHAESIATPSLATTPMPTPVVRPRTDSMPSAQAEDPLAESAALAHAARAALERGRPDVALTHARAHARRFREGELAEDAAALEIEALCRLGRANEAQTAADALQRRFPASAVAARFAETSCAQ